MTNLERIEIAYKKLKATVFFDKTLLPLRDEIVSFEESVSEEQPVPSELLRMEQALFDGENWEAYRDTILDSVGVLVYPKQLKSIDEDTAIFNSDSVPIELKKAQYFIDLSVQGHILGALWVLTFGAALDKNTSADNPDGMYEHSYGNRLRKKLLNDETKDYTFAPGLFEPYFSQYESWRDIALEKAKERLKDEQDALILTLDFKSFYYSVDIPKHMFDGFVEKEAESWKQRLNDLVYEILAQYSKTLKQVIAAGAEPELGERTILPIGFLPSNILANLVLTPFDDAITKYWNPVYFGRYVDDIIIVDKVEANSSIYKLARSTKKGKRLDARTVINMFLCRDDLPHIMEETEAGSGIYKINPALLSAEGSNIVVQDKKVKLFYFQAGATKALLNCFQSKIKDNVSEFRLMPELDAVYVYQNYSEIFQLKNEDSINKLRSVTGVKIDKFALSKFLGKYRKVGGMIEDKEEDVFARDVKMIFDERTLIENYSAWERLFEIFMVSDRVDLIRDISVKILKALDRYEVSVELCAEDVSVHNGLVKMLRAALCRVLALRWGKPCDKEIVRLAKELKDCLQKSSARISPELFSWFDEQELRKKRFAYCRTRMINKYILPLPIDAVLEKLSEKDEADTRLYSLESMGRLLSNNWYERLGYYRYHPYLVQPQDLSFALVYEKIRSGDSLLTPYDQREKISNLFIAMNYPMSDESRNTYSLENIRVLPRTGRNVTDSRRWYATVLDCAENEKKDKLCIAVGSARLRDEDFIQVLDRKPNRSYKRYRSTAEVFDIVLKAKEQKVDLLVLPENFLPFEWLPVVMRVCANNQIALVTGIEHVIGELKQPNGKEAQSMKAGCRGQVYNLTAVILPYMKDDYKFVHVAFHNKVEYSPGEIELINGYRYDYHKGDTYQLFCWKDVWFPVYCCYELTSIRDRSIFQTYADLVIAVEWNKDVPYFSNIVESLVRDMHCYCIQSNSSNYGDSRALQPADTNRRDIIKTKGGKNNIALIDTINIKELRDFQVKSIALQKKNGPFKQTPPDFDQNILAMKRDGTLADWIENIENGQNSGETKKNV